MKHNYAALTVTILLSACATPPNDIKATPIATNAYSGKSCSQLDAELYKQNSDLAPLLAKQQKTSDNDAAGVFIIGLPVGSMGESNTKQREADIAKMKGELDAIQKARVAGKC